MKQQGFTIIELMATTAIALTIGAVASHSIASTKYWLEPKRLFSAIQQTRTLAITHNQHAVLCPTSDGFTCKKDWQLPLMMFLDINNNKQRDDSESVIQTISPYANLERTIQYPRTQINFNGQGQINGYTGTLKYCSNYNSQGAVLSRIGRIRYILDLKNDMAAARNNTTCPNTPS
jgi:type IV fimbrial biogenesis protein FimT